MALDDFLAGGGEMGARIRAFDWSATPVGAPSRWSSSLRAIVSVLLSSRHPMFLWWGPQLVQFYNDGYRPSLGDERHPVALGARGREFWAEIWPAIGPQIEAVMTRGESTWNEDHLVPIFRYGRLDEVYWTYGYSPVRDDDGTVGGTLVVVQEQTARVISERRLRTLRDLASRAAASRTESEAWGGAVEALATNPHDLPWALLYAVSDDGLDVSLAGHTGPGASFLRAARIAGAPRPLRTVLETGAPVLIDDVRRRVGDVPGPAWPEPVHTAWLVPLRVMGATKPCGALVAGISPRLAFDALYQDFLTLAANQITTAIANARASEAERRRSEALAELDRAKTSFFSNVSHEFRTPLTLMLGPLEDLLARDVADDVREPLALMQRNARRLLRLVNTLLDFSRIESGRAEAMFEPTDVAAFTAELASAFRSATDQAGLSLTIDCPREPVTAYVDRDFWEKIVLNLVSNAFKFTFDGGITVRVEPGADHVVLVVADTGIGIPADELPHVFERFRRVRQPRARTYEGTGIGLALVQELVRMHGGKIEVASRVGHGTTFTVTLPLGAAHLPPERVGTVRQLAPTSLGASGFVEEARRWLPEAARDTPAEPGTVVLVDDNADMREYIQRLLHEQWGVVAFADGHAALEAIRARLPDLVLADVMMPGLDGFGLLRALRDDERTRDVSVILLSARAGEEARVEGLGAGADDYLTKPFSARELIARVSTHVALGRVRRESLAREQAARAAAETDNEAKDRFLAMLSHELRTPLTAMLGWAQLLVTGRVPADRLKSVAQAIQRSAQLQAQLVDDLLDVSRIIYGKMEITLRPTVLNGVVSAGIDGARGSADARGVEIHADLAKEDVVVDGDAGRLQQVVGNLLANAIKFTPAGGRITVSLSAEPDNVRIVVSDSGAGIAPEDLPHVFDRFHQAAGARTGSHGGLGLGLAIVRHLVERHGGRVSGASDGLGRGATFTVELPRRLDH